MQPANARWGVKAPARQSAAIDGRTGLLHAARKRLPAEQEEPDGAGFPQVPRRRRSLTSGPDLRMGADDSHPPVPRAPSLRSRLFAVAGAVEAAIRVSDYGSAIAAR